MQRNKARIQIAVYARPKHTNSFHWAILIAPKAANSQACLSKHHVKNTLFEPVPGSGEWSDAWRYEEIGDLNDISSDPRLLARFIVGKVQDVSAFKSRVKSIPIPPARDQTHKTIGPDGNPLFSCRTWIRDAVNGVREDQTDTNGAKITLSWDEIEHRARAYVSMKKDEGRWSADWNGEPSQIPLLDLTSGKEIVP